MKNDNPTATGHPGDRRADDVFTSFWDTKTGETVYLADSLMTGEMDETFAAEIEKRTGTVSSIPK